MSYSAQIKEYVYAHRAELSEMLGTLVAIPSVKGAAENGAPFGREPRRALDRMARYCESAGFATEITADAVGSADLEAGREAALGILCHLDVVPAEPAAWSSDPFALSERDGVLYGRGVIDDKGPAAAAFLAMKCVKELGIPLKKGVRLIFGTDEENGSEDLELYLCEKKLPPMVFTPDGEFPVINIEKGMMRSRFGRKFSGGAVAQLRGGSVPNAVPDKAHALLEGISAAAVNEAAAFLALPVRFTVTEEGGGTRVFCEGSAAHASTPALGSNALTALITLLSVVVTNGEQAQVLRGLSEAFPFGETDGAHMGLSCADSESGALTCVFSVFSMDKNGCEGTVDVRFPVSRRLAWVEQTERGAFGRFGCEFLGYMGDEPHCVDENSEFVQSLLRVYERVEGEKGCCIAIGGGTYVHNVEGGVAFGAERRAKPYDKERPDEGKTDYHMHGADEWVSEDELLRDAMRFAEVIAEICG